MRSPVIDNQNIKDGYELVYQRPATLVDTAMHYCPGCGHSVAHRVLMEVVEELDLQSRTVGVAPVGCAVFAHDYMDVDMQGAAHGRATAVATGIKHMLPDSFVPASGSAGQLACRQVPFALRSIDISQVWHVRAEPDPAQRWLRQVIGEVADIVSAGARALP